MIRLDDLPASCLPRTVREIAEVVGREKALLLVGAMTGRDTHRPQRGWVHIPQTVSADHWLSRLIGHDDALALCSEFRGIVLELSSCAGLSRELRNRDMLRDARAGVRPAVLATRYDLTVRQVRNILHEETAPEAKAA